MTVPELIDRILKECGRVEFRPASHVAVVRHELKSSAQVFSFNILDVRRVDDKTIAIVTDGQEIK